MGEQLLSLAPGWVVPAWGRGPAWVLWEHGVTDLQRNALMQHATSILRWATTGLM